MAASFPARLHAILAREAPVGLVLRRGPANAVCSLSWDRRNDRFELGQWVRARIYERRADISPDGRHWIYFARNSRWSSETRGSYTAVARVPWMKAIVLLGKGDCWQGGGLFTSASRYWVNGGCCHFPIRDSSEVELDPKFSPAQSYGGECPGVYYLRLQREGWLLRDCLSAGVSSQFTVFEKFASGHWILRKYAHSEVGPPPGRGCYWDEHELEHRESQRRIQFPNWEWADVDGETVVWAEHGCLHRASLGGEGLADVRMLADFNGMKFEARPAPY